MTKEQMEIINTMVSAVIGGGDPPRNIPFYEGQLLTFTFSKDMVKQHPATNDINAWTGIVAVDGTEVSVSQLVRRNNGLALDGDTVADRVKNFLTKVVDAENSTYRITIKAIRTRELIQSDGKHSQQRVLIFSE